MYISVLYTDYTSNLQKLKNIRQFANEGIRKSMNYFELKVKQNLSGKLVKVRTGRLRNSFNTVKKTDAEKDVYEFGSNVEYAGIVENGSNGLEKIKAHKRKTKFGSSSVSSYEKKSNRKGKFYFKTGLQNSKEILNRNVYEQIKKGLI